MVPEHDSPRIDRRSQHHSHGNARRKSHVVYLGLHAWYPVHYTRLDCHGRLGWADVELTAGAMLGRYRLLEQAGAGGMAEVWKAIQPSLDRVVAIKVLPRHLASEPGYIDRFRREARAISRLDHPHILGIYDFGEDDGYTYMVMPFVTGGTLAQGLGRPWSAARTVRVLAPLAEALEHAHARGIIHRDIKPSNVLVSQEGRVVLADFGIARITHGSLASSSVGAFIGTPAYMSPEQVRGIPTTSASDQYSLAVMAYELLTGRRPFEAESPMAVALAHVNREAPPPRNINPSIPRQVEDVLLKGLAKQADDRYPNVSAFTSALADAASHVSGSQSQVSRTILAGGPELVDPVNERPSAERSTVARPMVQTAPAPVEIRKRRVVWFSVAIAGLLIALGIGTLLARMARLDVSPASTIASATADAAPADSAARILPTAPPPAGQSPSPVTAPSTSTASEARSRTAGTGERVQIANTEGQGANLRGGPSSTAQRIKTVPDGTVVEVIGPNQAADGGTWRNVRDSRGDTGWILSGFLVPEGTMPTSSRPSTPSPIPTLSSTPTLEPATATPHQTTATAPSSAMRGQVGNTNGQGANIRSEPGAAGRILKILPEGATVEVLGPEREVDGQIWRQVREISSGATGWIVRGAVAPFGSVAAPAPTGTPAPAFVAPATKPSGVTPVGKPTAPSGDLPVIILPATPRPR